MPHVVNENRFSTLVSLCGRRHLGNRIERVAYKMIQCGPVHLFRGPTTESDAKRIRDDFFCHLPLIYPGIENSPLNRLGGTSKQVTNQLRLTIDKVTFLREPSGRAILFYRSSDQLVH